VAAVSARGAVEIAPNVHLEPDLLVMPAWTRVPETWLEVRDWWLAVEVSGRGSRIYDRDHKRPAYLSAGVREFWRVDLKDRCAYVSSPERPDERREDAGDLGATERARAVRPGRVRVVRRGARRRMTRKGRHGRQMQHVPRQSPERTRVSRGYLTSAGRMYLGISSRRA